MKDRLLGRFIQETMIPAVVVVGNENHTRPRQSLGFLVRMDRTICYHHNITSIFIDIRGEDHAGFHAEVSAYIQVLYVGG